MCLKYFINWIKNAIKLPSILITFLDINENRESLICPKLLNLDF